ncbi:MAG TPA: histidine kinase dimerization/phospho-acceptor domain-containing protein, partial [Terracidiphilus sp.]|nr:histidine kinase dimerization/phospho-acceptor domain-containing protein [Terracidiphilus sp.]
FSLLAGCLWAFQKQTMPRWISLALCIVLGGAGFRIYVTYGGVWALQFVECAAHIVTALLVLYVFRRISAGTVLTSLGFLAWSSRFFLLSPALTVRPMLDHALHNLIALGVIVAAAGLIMIAFESQAGAHQAGRDREARARKEIEAYTRLNLTIRRVEDLDHQAVEICRTVVDHSFFRQSALLLVQNPGRFQLAGTAGFDDAAVNALEAAAPRIPTDGLLALGTAEPVVPHAQTFPLHLESWLQPGDDIERLRLGEVLAVPLQGRSSFEGILLLAARRNPEDLLHAQDLLPAELLAARIQVARDRALMLEKLVDSEKFASLGQLSGSVTRQLNNPLTVILGYASMLEESTDLTPQMRKAIDAMVNEARSMRSTVDSLARMSHAQAGQIAAVSISELLSDMEQLHRTEFLHRSINFRLNVQPSMPLVHGNPQQIRQAVLYCIQFAIEAVESLDPSSDRAIRVEAAVHDGSVRVTIAHSGPSFVHPARAFDPFVPAPSGGETAGLGLSLCATILRENRGRITAINNEPRGAAIILDLQAA